MDFVDVAAVCTNVLTYCVVVPLIVYSLSRYNQYADVPFMEYRNKLLVFHINIHSIILAMMFTFIACTRIWKVIILPDWTTELVVGYGIDGIFVLSAIKTYLLYFQEHYNLSIIDSLFQQQTSTQPVSWFLVNRNRWGNLKFLLVRVFLPYTTFSATANCLSAHYLRQGLAYDFIHLSVSLLTQIPCLYLYFKVRHFKDTYKIAQEIYYSIIALIAVLTVFMCTFLSLRFTAFVHPRYTIASLTRLEWWLNSLIVGGLGASVALISTAYPVWHYCSIYRPNRNMTQSVAANAVGANSPSASTPKDAVRSMLKIIADPKMFKSFSEFLVTEFCVENLVFLVELVQIKHAFQANRNHVVRIPKKNAIWTKYELVDVSDSEMVEMDTVTVQSAAKAITRATVGHSKSVTFRERNAQFMTLDMSAVSKTVENAFTYFICTNNPVGMRLPFNLTTSSILREFHSFDEQLTALFRKYVENGSLYELNISYEQRDSLVSFFGELMDEKEIAGDSGTADKDAECDRFIVFDECAVEILGLLQDSFSRFQITPQYKQFVQGVHEHPDAVLPSFRDAESYRRMMDQSHCSAVTV